MSDEMKGFLMGKHQFNLPRDLDINHNEDSSIFKQYIPPPEQVKMTSTKICLFYCAFAILAKIFLADNAVYFFLLIANMWGVAYYIERIKK